MMFQKSFKEKDIHFHSLHLLCQVCGNKKEGQVGGSGKSFCSSTETWLRHKKRHKGTSPFIESFAKSSQGDPSSSSSQLSAGGQKIKVGFKEQLGGKLCCQLAFRDAYSGHAQSPQRQNRVKEQCSERKENGTFSRQNFLGNRLLW